jgi:beta-lactamase superfamily II metal-dependent hydrolase
MSLTSYWERVRQRALKIGIYMLDVGQGDSTLVLLPDHRAVIFDCADDFVLRRVLDDWQIRRIEAFVLSHLDQDHIAGAMSFLQGFEGEIGHVYLSPDRDVTDEHDDAKRAKALLDHVRAQSHDEGTRKRRWELHPNYRSYRAIVEGPGWKIILLAPPYSADVQRARERTWQDPNRYSSILRVEVGSHAMLLGGDAPLLSWSELRAEELPAQAFRVPHHGGAIDDGGVPPGWNVARLYREVGAETALISVGTNNDHGHPSTSWIDPVSGGRCRLLCTQVTGRCHGPLETITTGGRVVRDAKQISRLRVHVITQHHQWTVPQYRHLTDKHREIRSGQLEVPCAGTALVTLPLEGKIDVRPAPGGGHDDVVSGWEHPLCCPPPEADERAAGRPLPERPR